MEEIKGFVTFDEKEYPFSYADATLELFPSEFDPQSLGKLFATFERGKTIENIELSGITATRKNVVFEVPEQYSDHEGFLSFNVYSIFEYDPYRYRRYMENGTTKHETIESKIRGVLFKGVDVDIFYPPERAYSIAFPDDDNIRTSVCVKRIHASPLGQLTWKGVEVTFSAQYAVKQTTGATPLLCSSEIVAAFSDVVDLHFVQDIYYAVYQTFRYIMRRNNITFDRIEVFDVNEEGLRYRFGHYSDLQRIKGQETNKKKKRRALSYDCLQDRFSHLVKPFLEGIIYIDHLPADIDSVNRFGPDRMLFDFVAFEREYANLYPEDATRSKEYIEAKAETLVAVDGLISDSYGKKKKYLSAFRKRIASDENSLADRLLAVISDCKAIISPFLIYELGKEYAVEFDGISPLEAIASKMNTLRNDMAHGNLDIRLDNNHITGFFRAHFLRLQKKIILAVLPCWQGLELNPRRFCPDFAFKNRTVVP